MLKPRLTLIPGTSNILCISKSSSKQISPISLHHCSHARYQFALSASLTPYAFSLTTTDLAEQIGIFITIDQPITIATNKKEEEEEEEEEEAEEKLMPHTKRPPHPSALTALSPLKILTQILTLQASYYALGTVLILFTTLAAGKPFSLDLVLSWRSLRGDTTVGWTLGLCWMLDSFLGYIPLSLPPLYPNTHLTQKLKLTLLAPPSVPLLLILISRSKLIPDFTLTLHFLNLLITTLYTRTLPSNALWWVLQAASAAQMTALGIWACRWRELQPIQFGSAKGGPEGDRKSVV